MSKLGKRLIAAAREGRAIARREADPASYRIHVPAEIDVGRIRRQLDLSQDEFAARFGLSVATVREWEQDRRKPKGAARVLLTVIEKAPDAVMQALTDAASVPVQRLRTRRVAAAAKRLPKQAKLA
jgi:putative transcriptional regulator